ncbi:hypothetical protein EYF80_042395 [Liparis tanakae]|uniref:Uncharacterized protein n=1 Tax=Liparis tanakae TaxID=230148 RepID=A0A4Z2G4B0_9TELE|nr:hypothetical protein EYF80_042395 [Liparis tanakae]
MKESHSSMKVRVFSTPRVSEPQCSRPKLLKSLRTSSRSLDEMSQCRPSFISVKIQGLMRAPLKRQIKHAKSSSPHRKLGSTRSMGHPELMSTKSTSMLRLMSSAHLVMVSGKQPSTWRHSGNFRTEAIFTRPQADGDKVIKRLRAARTSLKENLR